VETMDNYKPHEVPNKHYLGKHWLRRRAKISEEELARRWDMAFGAKKPKK